jgi:predicted negative regulator of RcsB-dependent stress response
VKGDNEVEGLEAWKRDHRKPFILYIIVAVLGAVLGYIIWSTVL